MKNINIYILIGAALLSVLCLAVFLGKSGSVEIRTDKKVYAPGDTQVVSIKNNYGRTVCFSSCYPYRVEKRETEWKSYEYDSCSDTDVVDICLGKSETKKFKITLDEVETGINRINIGSCVDCKIGDSFKEDKVFYSNSFEVE